MFERFTGPDGQRVLRDALLRQPAIQGDKGLAEQLASIVTVEEVKSGSLLIQQDDTDNDMYFILVGNSQSE